MWLRISRWTAPFGLPLETPYRDTPFWLPFGTHKKLEEQLRKSWGGGASKGL